jgi:hypothetical protein
VPCTKRGVVARRDVVTEPDQSKSFQDAPFLI